VSKKKDQIMGHCEVCDEHYWYKDLLPVKAVVYSCSKDVFVDAMICNSCKEELDNKGPMKWEGGPSI